MWVLPFFDPILFGRNFDFPRISNGSLWLWLQELILASSWGHRGLEKPKWPDSGINSWTDRMEKGVSWNLSHREAEKYLSKPGWNELKGAVSFWMKLGNGH
jgi:hypothetical protein